MDILAIVIVVFLALAFFAAGSGKLIGNTLYVENFKRWGYPQWFRVATGLGEVIGAIGLIVGIWRPTVAAFAGLWLACILLGAIFTHLTRDANGVREAVGPGLLLVLAVVVVIIR